MLRFSSAGGEVAPSERLHLREHGLQFGSVEVVAREVAGGHRREAHLGEAELVEQVVPDADHVGGAVRERHARPDRARAVVREQQTHLARHGLVAALAADRDAVAVVHCLRSVDAHRDAEAVPVEPGNGRLVEQRGVRGQREHHALAHRAEALLGVSSRPP